MAHSKSDIERLIAGGRFGDALRSGAPWAKLVLADFHETHGRHEIALNLVRQAAEQGYSPAHYRIGRYYLRGLGVPKSDAAAKRCMEEAANRGHLLARLHIAGRMLKGEYGLVNVVPGLGELLVIAHEVVREAWLNPGSRLLAR